MGINIFIAPFNIDKFSLLPIIKKKINLDATATRRIL
jgi:hypothetical protein